MAERYLSFRTTPKRILLLKKRPLEIAEAAIAGASATIINAEETLLAIDASLQETLIVRSPNNHTILIDMGSLPLPEGVMVKEK